MSKEKEGIVSLPCARDDGDETNLDFLKKYADLDITVRVQDHPDGIGDPRTAIWLSYDNGKVIKFSVHTENGRVKLQTANGNLLEWQEWGPLTTEEIAQYQTAEGIDYRLVRKGNMFYQLIGDRLVSTINLAEKIDGNLAAEMENMEAKITIRHDGDEGANIEIPFAITGDVTAETISGISGTTFPLFDTVNALVQKIYGQ